MRKNQVIITQLYVIFGIIGVIAYPSFSQIDMKQSDKYSFINSNSKIERPENIRFLQSIQQVEDARQISSVFNIRPFEMLTYKYGYLKESLQSDFTLNGETDKHDVFLYASQWSSLPGAIPNLDRIVWQTKSGTWDVDTIVSGQGLHESRIVSLQTVPDLFSAKISFRIVEGNSAGFLFWADSSADTGFVVRYDVGIQSLILSRIGPRLEEDRLDTFPITNNSGTDLNLRIKTSTYTIRIFLSNQLEYPVLEATNITPMGSHIGWYLYDAKAEFELHSLENSLSDEPELFIPNEGEYHHIFDQSVGETEPWYINDHCFVQDQTGTWHLFGTSNTSSPLIPLDEDQFSHATASQLTQSPWQKLANALTTDTTVGESQLWAPHVFFKDGLYHMFYCAGSQFSSLEYRMHLATSSDLVQWRRHEANPLFQGYFDARDPMIFQDGERFIMYYTANSDRPTGNHIVAYRTSDDLINWSLRKTAFTHETEGTFGGPTESPYVVKYEDHYYLFIGPENLNTTPDEDYRRTAVYRSSNPLHWDQEDRVTSVRSHAAEVIQDNDGSWYVSHCGWFYNGVFIAPLEWVPSTRIRLYVNLGESLEYVTDHFFAMVSDWRGTGGLDLVADFGSFFDLELPVDSKKDEVIIEFEEEGETLLRIQTPNGFQTILDEGNTGPGEVTIHKINIESNQILNSKIILRFRDSDPADGWGPNVNWIRILQ